jgi:hypothetical protein
MNLIILFSHFVSAFVRSCWWKARGYQIIASDWVKRDRVATCGVCPDRKDDICTLCGCPIISKVTLCAEQCPKKYWLREKVALTPK